MCGHQCTDGKHSNQDCARAYIKQQHFEKRPCKELNIKTAIYKFYVSLRTEGVLGFYEGLLTTVSIRIVLFCVRGFSEGKSDASKRTLWF